jgi:hypothetical protein
MLSNRRSLGLYGIGGVMLLVLAVFAYRWWARPPAVEYDNLKYIQLLRTAVSSRRDDYVQGVERAVRMRHQERAMSEAELAHFDAILATARSGNWEQADRMAFDFESAQSHRRRTRPRSDEHHTAGETHPDEQNLAGGY